MKRWETASHAVRDHSRSQREELRRTVHQEFNEHAAAAVEQMVGRITLTTLTQLFDWRIVEINQQQVSLEAIPRDSTERLFYRSLRVVLSADDACLRKVGVVSRKDVFQVVWQADNPQENHAVQLVRFEDEVPPAPRLR
jgi:hypothetical protein